MYGREQKQSRGFIARIIDVVMVLCTLFFAALLVLIYRGSGVNPNVFWPFAFLTLGLPIIMFFNIVIMLYWVFKWRWFFILPLAVLLVGLGDVSTFFKPSISKKYDNQVVPREALKVVSYNVGGFLNMSDEGYFVSVFDSTLSYLSSLDADIICMQEFEANYRNPKYRIDSLLADLAYNSTFYAHSREGDNGWGLAVYSKYPIVNSGGISYPSNNGSMWVDVLVGRDTIHLFNNHLQSMKITPDERKMFDLKSDQENIEQAKLKSVFGKVKDNFMLRADQADSLAMLIANYDKRTLVCGDFNDTPMSYTYRTMKGDMVDTFQERGSGPANTYRDMFGIFRIDYIFHSQDISTLSYKTLDKSLSDHNAIEVKILLD